MEPKLGRIGVYTGALGLVPAARARGDLAEIEELGYGAIWYPEGPATKESLTQAALLLAWSERIVVAPGIANIWARDPVAMANAARGLAEAYPGRFLLGIGIGNALSVGPRGHTFERPVSKLRSYLDAMDAAPYDGPGTAPSRVLAAIAPAMLRIAANRCWGAFPYFVTPEYTASARSLLGPGPRLVVAQPVLLVRDADEARAVARGFTAFYLQRPAYRVNLRRFGFSDDEFEDGGSDRLVDAIVAWGGLETAVDRVRAHLDAGADHVCVQPLGATPADAWLRELRELASPLHAL
jgi:probable F420-dependent oxidoreductase